MVVVQNVSKRYRLYDRPSDRLLELLPFRSKARHKDFWALRNISFSVQPGEILGIVGPNGCGKSTILQIAAGILQPSSGRVSIEGRIAALLELGAGFNPEFSGRENVFLNAEIMGFSRKEAERAFPRIRDFAEIGEFIDRPVKEYSSGMYVRLAFATAIHTDPDILIVDEALAVGDAIFASRCIRKLEDLKQRNISILFVSHDLGLVKRLCNHAILLLKGEIIRKGNPSDVVNRYIGLVHGQDLTGEKSEFAISTFRHGDRTTTIKNVRILDQSNDSTNVIRAGDLAIIEITAKCNTTIEGLVVGILIRNRLGIEIFGTNSKLEQIDFGRLEDGTILTVRFSFPCFLTRQEYTVTVATQNPDGSSQDWLDDLLSFTVVDERDAAGLTRFQTDVSWTIHSDREF